MSDTVESEVTLVEENVAIKTPEHLKRWLVATKRDWFVFNSAELVDALPWPHGCSALVQLLEARKHHRAVIPTGDSILELDPITGDQIPVPEMHGEALTVAEMDRAIRFLVTQITEVSPGWSFMDVAL